MKSRGKRLKKRRAISQLGVITKSFINGFAKRHRTDLLCLTKLEGKTKGQAHPWVESLRTSHLNFFKGKQKGKPILGWNH